MFKLNKTTVKKARAIIEAKRPYWEKKLQVKFDKDGRAVMGSLTSFDESDWRNIVLHNMSEHFCECFLKGLDELGIERFSLKSLGFEDYKKKRVTVTTTKGRVQEKSLASLLQKAHNIWEKEFDIYRAFRNHMKLVRSEDGGMEMYKLNNILKTMEVGNTYVAYDRLLREFQERPILISLNPLDKLFASGGTGSSYEETLTKFSSCWSNRIKKEKDDIYNIQPVGVYANPLAQMTLGSHISSGMVIISNGNKITVGDMDFYGMLQRSHMWLYDAGVFVENIYPDKYNVKRIQEIDSILSLKTKVVKPTKWTKITTTCEGFDKEEWFNELKRCYDVGRHIYIDRAGIDENNGDVWISPTFRHGGFGGTCWVPRSVVR